nr:hypothetical protein [Tanacetum cinerariifolium]
RIAGARGGGLPGLVAQVHAAAGRVLPDVEAPVGAHAQAHGRADATARAYQGVGLQVHVLGGGVVAQVVAAAALVGQKKPGAARVVVKAHPR